MNQEGRLEDFNARREQFRAALREQGMRRKEAADQAWRQALAEFPPLASDPGSEPGSVEAEDGEEPADDAGLEEALAQFNASENEAELESDAMWVYTHLSARNLSPADAPSPGAWSMLLVARKDKRWFLKDVLPKLRRKREDEEEKSSRRAEKKSIAEGQALLRGMLRRADEELAKNDRVFDCPSGGVRVLLATMFSQFTNEPRYAEPVICPDDHPLFH